jgi:EAL domain-containing protein (putative c-di-GMP-specific phosphodiesterase class I)
MDELTSALEYAVGMHRLGRLKREALEALGRNSIRASDPVGLDVQFTATLEALWMAYQPIVSMRERCIVGYEALMRSREKALPHPGAILDAAEQLDKLPLLAQRIRSRVVQDAVDLPAGVSVFLNLHPRDLDDELLYVESNPLFAIADRVVLELTERESLDGVGQLESRVDQLRAKGFRIAVDDLGSGYAGLNCLARLRPDLVKVDMGLVRGIGADPARQRIVGSLLEVCDSLNSRCVVEGIEDTTERDTLLRLGADLLQGYYFARPGPGFTDLSQGKDWFLDA